jgi:S-methylmethionine-dependent homocysteine/selenocysteine methylase
MGSEIARRGVENREDIWSTNALMVAPEVVRQRHIDCIRAGADIIITDTYSVARSYLALAGIEDRFEELSRTAQPARQPGRRARRWAARVC